MHVYITVVTCVSTGRAPAAVQARGPRQGHGGGGGQEGAEGSGDHRSRQVPLLPRLSAAPAQHAAGAVPVREGKQ